MGLVNIADDIYSNDRLKVFEYRSACQIKLASNASVEVRLQVDKSTGFSRFTSVILTKGQQCYETHTAFQF